MRARFVNHGTIITMEAIDNDAREWCKSKLVDDDGNNPMRPSRWEQCMDCLSGFPLSAQKVRTLTSYPTLTRMSNTPI